MARPTSATTIQQAFGAPIEVPHGAPEGYGPEQGVDVALPAGTAVRLPVAAVYQPGLSGNYQSVFRDLSGLGLSFTHIDPFGFSPGAVLPAGTEIGTVSARAGSPVAGTTSPYGSKYYSTGPHLEFGVYSSPYAAATWQYAASSDPAAYLARSSSMAQKASGSGGSSPAPNTNTGWSSSSGWTGSAGAPNPQPSWPGGNIPVVGGIGDALGAAWGAGWNAGQSAGTAAAAPFQSIGQSANSIGQSVQQIQQFSTDMGISFDKIAKVLPLLVIGLAVALMIGFAKHGL